jgi:hypothetical protein
VFVPWNISQLSNDGAVRNAREATTTLSRMRVEREEVEHYLAQAAERYADRHPA